VKIENKLIIIGNGYSTKYYSDFINSFPIKIGYNTKNRNEIYDYYYYSLYKENNEIKLKNDIYESIIIKEFNINPIYVGTTTFGLYSLLKYIEKYYKTFDIYLVGFDFRYTYEMEDESNSYLQNKININAQSIAFENLINNFTNLNIFNVGFDLNSNINPKNNKIFNNTNFDVEIVAEITTNHFGEFDRLIKLIEGAKISGANSVKLQMRDVETFYSKEKLNSLYISPFGKTFYDYRKALELNTHQIYDIIEYCRSININIFFSILDFISFEKYQKFRLDRIKLPSTISNNKKYIEHVVNVYNKEIVISTGMTDQSYIDFILKLPNSYDKLYLLHCISSYPVPLLDCNINIIKNFLNINNKVIPGYSSHDIGSLGSILAISSGAKMIEKHIKIGRNDFAHFDETALDVFEEFPEFVRNLRNTERVLGSQEKIIYDFEHHKY
jgi:sialic acid synthase SpsE